MNDSEPEPGRRDVLRAGGALLATAGVTGLAGCTGSSGGGGPGEDGGGSDGSGGDDGGSGTGGNGDGDGGGGGQRFDGYLASVTNFDGVVDRTDESEVRVRVGSEANGGYFGYDPAAVRVSTGTTVVWEWTGRGAAHNVLAEDGSFNSSLTSEEGFTYERAFDAAGTYKYYCRPHRAVNMKGVVVVE